MRKQKLEQAVVLSLMLAALQQNSVLAGDAISKEEYIGDKDKYYSYQDAVSIDKFVESQFSYKAASAVSAGSTGALLAGATLLVKRIHGIRRAAMGPVIPTAGGRMLLCDCGANAECTPEYLLQFAYLGSYYAQRVLRMERPRVALLNIGSEEAKGDTLRHEAYELLRSAGEAGRIHFIGNVEANEAMMGTADVIVTDGFTGNVMLKTMEGVGKFLLKSLKEMFLSSTKTKLAAGLVKGDLGQMKKLLDPSEVGGTPFLGIQKPVIKAHGGSNARAIENAVLRAKEYAESGFIADIQANIEHMRVQPGMKKN